MRNAMLLAGLLLMQSDEPALPAAAGALVAREFPGWTPAEFATGDLFGDGPHDIALSVFRRPESGSPQHLVIVLRRRADGDYAIVEHSKPIAYNPAGEGGIDIARRSVYVRESWPSARTIEDETLQYRHDGTGFLLIGRESETTFRDPQPGEVDTRVSENFLTDTVVTTGAKGTTTEKRELGHEWLRELGDDAE